MNQRSFVNLSFIAVTLFLLSACNNARTGDHLSTSEPHPPAAAPILSPALDRDCEFRVPTGDKLKVGDLAVDFTLKDIHGNEFTLSELLSEKPVVLIFGSYT